MKTITFVCKVNEVGEKVCMLESVIKHMTYNCWEMLPTVVTPLGGGCEVLVIINYNWGFKFPVPQNFEEMFGDSPEKKSLRESYIDTMRETWENK